MPNPGTVPLFMHNQLMQRTRWLEAEYEKYKTEAEELRKEVERLTELQKRMVLKKKPVNGNGDKATPGAE